MNEEPNNSSPPEKQAPPSDEIKREIKAEIAQAIQDSAKSPDESGKKDGRDGGDQKDSPGERGQAGDKEDGDKKDEQGDDKKKPGFKWTPLKVIGLVVVVLIVLVVGAYYIIYALGHETTDDAYTTGFVHQISSRVTGNVVELDIVDNQYVRQGEVLLKLDPRDYLVQVAKAQADYDKSKADFDRVDALKNDVAISKQDYDQTKTNMEVAKANLDDAHNQLDYCTIVAPTDGYIGNRTVNVGDRVTVGGALMVVVQDVWVVANYKETQLAKMKKNQRVQITVDAIPGHTFEGHIDSFSPGTGTVFALLPTDNATGNLTKIVQRIPVKILFQPDSIRGFRGRLAPGLSVETAVDLDPSVKPAGDQVNKAGQ
jgi:membrane fusion protein (multidrug efflux system)